MVWDNSYEEEKLRFKILPKQIGYTKESEEIFKRMEKLSEGGNKIN